MFLSLSLKSAVAPPALPLTLKFVISVVTVVGFGVYVLYMPA